MREENDPKRRDGVLGQDIVATLRMLECAKADGTLIVRTNDKEAFFALRRGLVLSAHSLVGERTGDSLVRKGALSPQTLESALSLQRRKRVSQPLASLLVSLGVVQDSAALEVLEEQCAKLLAECRDWDPQHLDFEYSLPEQSEFALVHDGFSVEDLLDRVAG